MTPSRAADAAATVPARAVFFGSGGFALPILQALLDLPAVAIVGVVTAPDRPAGRKGAARATPVARAARASGLALLQPASLRDGAAVAAIRDLRPEVGLLADYGRIVPQAILDLPAAGFLNVHPSLLPRHRGAAPIPAAILGGDSRTGVTIIRMEAGLDTGPIVAAEAFPLEGTETAPELEARAAAIGAELTARVVPRWLRGEIVPAPQSEASATMTRPLRRDDGRLVPNLAAAELERRVRAMQPWPGAWLQLAGTPDDANRVAVLRASVAPPRLGDIAATIVDDDGGVAISTGSGRLRLIEVQPAGRRAMSGEAWRRGRPGIIGTAVEFRAVSGSPA
ncbi:MAG TPA: methionyl-tRNA formyltransferase [Candidatus Limnocylindrales bacterium]|nr:methionyl-tRNA formyltransferase [Candidatus Limnocylindrales bacterium]